MEDYGLLLNEYDTHYNARIKYIPTVGGGVKAVQVMVADRNIFNPDGVELAVGKSERRGSADGDDLGIIEDKAEEKAEGSSRAPLAAARRFRDIVDCTPQLNLFVTMTLSPAEMEKRLTSRYDYAGIVKLLRPWLSNRVQREGLKYVLVPERHKDGALHFHGFMNEVESMELVENERGLTTKGGAMIYNMRGYPYGYTTACCIGSDDDRIKAARYCAKYCTKNTECIGGRYYFSGGDLGRPIYKYFHFPYDEAMGDVYPCEGGMVFKVTRVEDSNSELTVLGLLNGNKLKDGVADEMLERLWFY